jgi:hypothetical protein
MRDRFLLKLLAVEAIILVAAYVLLTVYNAYVPVGWL